MDRRVFGLLDGDLVIDTDRNIHMISGDDEISQALSRLFTTDAGEWFLNPNHGLQYPMIRGKWVTNEQIQMAVVMAALQEARVREIIEIEINKDVGRRTVDIAFICRVNTGATVRVPFSF